ncbi:MAG: hypothetical protein V3T17_12295 [Pseudomonadales bacterium]
MSRENRVRPVLPVGDVQFSQFDLEMQAINRAQTDDATGQTTTSNILDATAPAIASSDDLITALYSLFSNQFQPLTPIDGDREWVLALGTEEQRVTMGQDQTVQFSNVEHLAGLDVEDLSSTR